MVKRSLEELAADLEEKLKRVREEIALRDAAQAKEAELIPGTKVTFRHPAASTAVREGIIVGTRMGQKGLWIKVRITSDKQEEVVSTRASQIISIDT